MRPMRSAFSAITSPQRMSIRPRCVGDNRPHEVWNAASAADTAASTSLASDSTKAPQTPPVVGLTDSKVAPAAPAVARPSIWFW